MTVVKRFHDCLLPTHQQVLDTYEKFKSFAVNRGFLCKASGYQFYNTSKFTFDRLLADPDNIQPNFEDYLNGFSENVQDILAKFEFENIIKRMVESNTLYLVVKEFASSKGYLGPDKISAVDCGYIFEDLVRRFSESFGEEAGAHFTSRDVIYLMTDLLLSDACMDRQENVTVYDMTMGTSRTTPSATSSRTRPSESTGSASRRKSSARPRGARTAASSPACPRSRTASSCSC
jgi:type I restriction enzyme M protein